jgi:hypothetical protein
VLWVAIHLYAPWLQPNTPGVCFKDQKRPAGPAIIVERGPEALANGTTWQDVWTLACAEENGLCMNRICQPH